MRVCLLIALLAAGCARSSDSSVNTVTGRISDTDKKVSMTVPESWKLECWQKTRDAVFAKTENPKTCDLSNMPSYEAYYDSQRDVSTLVIYGNFTSRGNYGQNYKQSYYVTWEQQGKADTQSQPWELSAVSLNDSQF
jgi:hypothetical protein